MSTPSCITFCVVIKFEALVNLLCEDHSPRPVAGAAQGAIRAIT